MHSLEILQEALRVAKRLGYGIRQEWIGSGGGVCQIRGRRWLFVDLSQSVNEQLALVCDVLRQHPQIGEVAMSDALRRYLSRRLAG